MDQFLTKYAVLLILYFPLGVIGAWRWSVWLIKKIISLNYKPTENSMFNGTVSIITPVYNENPALFKSALNSWKENNPHEIIAVIDESDKKCAEVFQQFKKDFKNSKLIITDEPGKRPALARGIKKSKGEILALVDSDTIWEKNIKEKILAPFADESVGGVGTRQKVLKTNTLARIFFSIHLDMRYLFEMPFMAAAGNAVTCLSGRTAVYRRKALLSVVDSMENETFLGKKCVSGEDKCLTRLVQEKRWKVRYQENAIVWTSGAKDIKTFVKQQIRWSRNSWRSDVKSLYGKWIIKEKWLAFHMIDRFFQPFTLILGPIYFAISLILGYYSIAISLVLWWIFSRTFKIIPHLKEKPLHILVLPFYVAMIYFMAILKIFTLLTIHKQGWLTRWDENRMAKFGFIRNVPSYAGTAGIIFLLTLVVTNYNNTFASLAVSKETEKISLGNSLDNIQFSDINISESDFKKEVQNIIDQRDSGKFGYYTAKKGDTIEKIAKKYNADLNILINENKNIANTRELALGTQIKIPVAELRNTPEKEKIIASKETEPIITYNENNNTITVQGKGSFVTFPKIYEALKEKNVLVKNGKEWLLKANLFTGRDVTLIIDGSDVSWLKLLSEENAFMIIRSYNGNILIKDTKITSWDENKNNVDTNHIDGRSFILSKYDGRMDIINSEIAYLGYGFYGVFPKEGQPFGGSYGLSWKMPAGSFKKYLISGNILDSKIHNNYFGLYTYGATGMVIKNNNVYKNVEYGIDPHDDSNNLIIEDNISHSNGNHGIIVSKRCINNTFRRNVSYNNRLHGIMLDRQSNYNIVEDNLVFDNTDGLAIFDSHKNIIKNNKFNGSTNGIRVNANSSKNYFEENEMIKNKNGIYIYDNSNENFSFNNKISENSIGIYIKNATKNIIKSSIRKGENLIDIRLGGNSNGNIIERI